MELAEVSVKRETRKRGLVGTQRPLKEGKRQLSQKRFPVWDPGYFHAGHPGSSLNGTGGKQSRPFG